jgi:large subunit ribosomal protein L31
MKTDNHPDYVECQVHCSCGNEFTTRSTVPSLRVELCSECHPFFTGKQKLVDTGGRVDRFNRRLAKKAAPAKGKGAPKAGKGAKADDAEKATAEA